MNPGIVPSATNSSNPLMNEPNEKLRQSATEVRSYTVMEDKSLKTALYVKGFQRQRLLAGLALLSASSVLLLSGCSSAYNPGLTATGSSMEVSQLTGKVHGGQFPVIGSSVQIYEVGATAATASGYGSAATPLGTAVLTGSDGGWTYGAFTCTNPNDELFVAATGGNPGLTGNLTNASLSMTAALGQCSNVSNVGFIVINEVTTVATEYSLAGFSGNTYTKVGTSASSVNATSGVSTGLVNAFNTFNNLVNINTGVARTVTPAYANPPAGTTPDVFHGTVPYDTIYTLANALGACVNTDGGSNSTQGGTAGACALLFSYTGGSASGAPGTSQTITDTATAALWIAHNPGLPAIAIGANNLTALFDLVPATAPFGPGLSTPPVADYSLTLNFIGGGLGGVTAGSTTEAEYLAIDASGNVWVPSYLKGEVAELNNLGAPLSPTTLDTPSVTLGGFQGGGMAGGRGIAIDLNGNAWIADKTNCLVEFSPSGSPLSGSGYTAPCAGLGAAKGVSVDASNQVWVAGASYLSAANSSTGAIASGSFPLTGSFGVLTGWTGPDYSGNTWFVDEGVGAYGRYNETGTTGTTSPGFIATPGTYDAFGPVSSALEIWEFELGEVDNLQPLYTSTVATLPGATQPQTANGPEGVAVDGAGKVYFVNQAGDAPIGEVPYNISVVSSSAALLSPYYTGYTGGSELTFLDRPYALSVDQSGNLWVLNVNDAVGDNSNSNYLGNGVNSSNLTEFVGFAAPTNPVSAQAAYNGQHNGGVTAAGAYGVKP
jgi:hypothetical protein